MHFVLLEQVFDIHSLLNQDFNLLLVGMDVQLLLGDQLLQLDDLTGWLFGLELYHKILELLDSLDEALGVLGDVFGTTEILVGHEAHEVFDVSLHFF